MCAQLVIQSACDAPANADHLRPVNESQTLGMGHKWNLRPLLYLRQGTIPNAIGIKWMEILIIFVTTFTR